MLYSPISLFMTNDTTTTSMASFMKNLPFTFIMTYPYPFLACSTTLSTISYHHNKHVIVLFLLIITNIMCVCVRGGLGVFAFHRFIGRGCLPQQWSLKTRLLQFPVIIVSFPMSYIFNIP